jgi:H+/Cl- antiporter ClcA
MGDGFLGRYEFDPLELQYWYFAVALGTGFVGAIVAVVIGSVLRLVGGWFSRFDHRPILRAVIGGAVVGVIGYVLPATMFSGVVQLESVFQNAATIGIALLLVTAFAKIVTLSVSLGSGFCGGPFFPIFFIGGVIGTAFHLLVPSFPLALAVGGFMGATAGAAASIPLSIMLFALFLVGVGPPAAAVIGIVPITGFVFIQGFGFGGRPTEPNPEASP